MKFLKRRVTICIVIYSVLCFFVFIYQKNFIFFPSNDVLEIPKNMNIKELFITTNDDIEIHAWYLDNDSEKTVLFFHGNAGNVSDRVRQLEIFSLLNFNALVIDYRGYGKSEGDIKKESDLYTDAQAGFNYLLQTKSLQEKDIIIWGRSLGGAIAIDLAQNKNVFAVIIESTFSSMDDMAKDLFWFLPVDLLGRFHFKSDEKIENISSKLLVIHSKEDETIPFEHGLKLFDKSVSDKNFLEIVGSHNNGSLQSYDLYMDALKEFLIE